ncbi:MAG: hypothetical protein KKG14_00065 [Alphaproteobacteria bacterium]|nr:hypothetical protein [Alphaproteobacteria bacterium]MBU2271416.1 hypothetical protein [Alphaproteobacteria bacterium]MBU2417089.1 hypothetical protein [Alphaproteobacteria bacterium]
MERRTAQQWSVTRSLALLAAIFAVMLGATLPSAVAASPVTGHPIELCSGDRIFVVDDGSGQPVRQDPAPADSLKCAACLAVAFVALPPPPFMEPPAAPGPAAEPRRRPVFTTSLPAARVAPRPPSTAPPIA